MFYVKAIDNAIVRYPYTQTDLVRDNPSTSFPSGPMSPEQLAKWNVFSVQTSEQPNYDPTRQVISEEPPVYNGSVWIQQWAIRNLTDSEYEAAKTNKAAEMRADRNKRLAVCDWTQVNDSPVDKTVWAVYRQSLRDVTSQPGFPWQITWPTEPQ